MIAVYFFRRIHLLVQYVGKEGNVVALKCVRVDATDFEEGIPERLSTRSACSGARVYRESVW